LPILIFLFALILGTKPGTAFLAGLKVGIGLIGVNLVTGLIGSGLGDAAKVMTERLNLQLTNLDVGWPASAAIANSTQVGSLAIPIGLAVNIVLIVIGLTRTLNIDLWNFWHAAFIGSLCAAITDDFGFGLFMTVVSFMLLLLFGDLVGPVIKKFYGFEGLTFPHGTSAPGFFVALPLNWIFDRIPGFKNVKADTETIQKRFGVFGDATIIGVMIGLAVGLAAYAGNTADVLADDGTVTQTALTVAIYKISSLTVQTGAIMLILPRMVAILMEGLIPVSEAANVFVSKRFPGRKLYLGMDSALSIGHPAVLSSSLLLIPITVILALVLPGNTTLPFVDLATIPFVVCLMCAVFGGNIIRTLIGGTLYLGVGLYISSWAAEYITKFAKDSLDTIAENGGLDPALIADRGITSLADGAMWPTFMFGMASNAHWIGGGILAVVVLVGLIITNKVWPKMHPDIDDVVQAEAK
jgi:PTS system galactitol-specific IIC component